MVIATRSLKLRTAGGETAVSVRVFRPEPRGADWSCRFEIDWPENARSAEIYGADSVQALHLAMQTIGAEIYTSEYHKAGQLSLDGQARGYGFPVPSTLRDLLVGDDARYL